MSLRQSGTPAWQRLQAVRAVEAYRDAVLRRGEPSLGEVWQALQRLAEREREGAETGAAGASGPGVEDERHLVGMIDPDEPPCVQELLGHKDVRTTMIYAHVMNKQGFGRRFCQRKRGLLVGLANARWQPSGSRQGHQPLRRRGVEGVQRLNQEFGRRMNGRKMGRGNRFGGMDVRESLCRVELLMNESRTVARGNFTW